MNPSVPIPYQYNTPIQKNGLWFMGDLPSEIVRTAFIDPQYRGVLNHLSYGNEGKQRGTARAGLEQMNDNIIKYFIIEASRTLAPSGHLFLWVDKYHLCSDISEWFDDAPVRVVDMIVWDKGRIGMGYRSRRRSEYLIVAQKTPTRAKGVWTRHDIPDVWVEKIPTAKKKEHPHIKPEGLIRALLEATTTSGEVVLDPCAGSFEVMRVCDDMGRRFLGCDLVLPNSCIVDK